MSNSRAGVMALVPCVHEVFDDAFLNDQALPKIFDRKVISKEEFRLRLVFSYLNGEAVCVPFSTSAEYWHLTHLMQIVGMPQLLSECGLLRLGVSPGGDIEQIARAIRGGSAENPPMWTSLDSDEVNNEVRDSWKQGTAFSALEVSDRKRKWLKEALDLTLYYASKHPNLITEVNMPNYKDTLNVRMENAGLSQEIINRFSDCNSRSAAYHIIGQCDRRLFDIDRLKLVATRAKTDQLAQGFNARPGHFPAYRYETQTEEPEGLKLLDSVSLPFGSAIISAMSSDEALQKLLSDTDLRRLRLRVAQTWRQNIRIIHDDGAYFESVRQVARRAAEVMGDATKNVILHRLRSTSPPKFSQLESSEIYGVFTGDPETLNKTLFSTAILLSGRVAAPTMGAVLRNFPELGYFYGGVQIGREMRNRAQPR